MNDTFLWQKAGESLKMNEVMSKGNKTQLKGSLVENQGNLSTSSQNDGNGLYYNFLNVWVPLIFKTESEKGKWRPTFTGKYQLINIEEMTELENYQFETNNEIINLGKNHNWF